MKHIANLFILLWVLPLHAAIIDNDTYTTVNGLDWLDLSITNNMSTAEALSNYSDYSLPTKDQYVAMMTEFYSFSGNTIAGVSSTVSFIDHGDYLYTETRAADYGDNDFSRLFGLTFIDDSSGYVTGRWGFMTTMVRLK